GPDFGSARSSYIVGGPYGRITPRGPSLTAVVRSRWVRYAASRETVGRTSMSESNEQLFLGLLHAWESGGADACSAKIRELFTDDCIWHQPSLATTKGPDEAIAIVQSWGSAFSTFELEIRNVASTETSVLV